MEGESKNFSLNFPDDLGSEIWAGFNRKISNSFKDG